MIRILPSLAAANDQWPLYLVSGLTLTYFLIIRPMLRKKKPDPLEKLPRLGLSAERRVEQQMQGLLVELAEMARQISAQLDTRAAKLQSLMDQADQRIEELRRAGVGAKPSRSDSAPAVAGERPHLRITPRDDEAEDASAAPDTSDADPSTDAEAQLQEPASPHDDPRHTEIYSLAEQGMDARAISQRLNRPRGEVELILALRAR